MTAKISQSSTVSLSLFGVAIASLVGAIMWASGVAAKVDVANEKVSKLERMAEDVADIKAMLAAQGKDIEWMKRNITKE